MLSLRDNMDSFISGYALINLSKTKKNMRKHHSLFYGHVTLFSQFVGTCVRSDSFKCRSPRNFSGQITVGSAFSVNLDTQKAGNHFLQYHNLWVHALNKVDQNLHAVRKGAINHFHEQGPIGKMSRDASAIITLNTTL